jgi:hypothetical protein
VQLAAHAAAWMAAQAALPPRVTDCS